MTRSALRTCIAALQAQSKVTSVLQKHGQTGTGLMGSGMGVTEFSKGYSKGCSHTCTSGVTAKHGLRFQLVVSMHTRTPETALGYHTKPTWAPCTLQATRIHGHLKQLLSIMHIWAGVHNACSHAGKPAGSLLTKARHFRLYRADANVCCPCYCSRQ